MCGSWIKLVYYYCCHWEICAIFPIMISLLEKVDTTTMMMMMIILCWSYSMTIKHTSEDHEFPLPSPDFKVYFFTFGVSHINMYEGSTKKITITSPPKKKSKSCNNINVDKSFVPCLCLSIFLHIHISWFWHMLKQNLNQMREFLFRQIHPTPLELL